MPLLYQLSAPERGAEEERLVVDLTTSESEFSAELHSRGFIRSPLAFNIFLTLRGGKGKIEPGAYLVSKSMNAPELIEILVNHPYQKWVVTPEGLRKEEVAAIVKDKLGWTDSRKKEFLEGSEEGYLFPDTYLLNLDYSGEEVAKRMMDQFNEKVADLFFKAGEQDIRNDTLIVMASLVQREAASGPDLQSGIGGNRSGCLSRRNRLSLLPP